MNGKTRTLVAFLSSSSTRVQLSQSQHTWLNMMTSNVRTLSVTFPFGCAADPMFISIDERLTRVWLSSIICFPCIVESECVRSQASDDVTPWTGGAWPAAVVNKTPWIPSIWVRWAMSIHLLICKRNLSVCRKTAPLTRVTWPLVESITWPGNSLHSRLRANWAIDLSDITRPVKELTKAIPDNDLSYVKPRFTPRSRRIIYSASHSCLTNCLYFYFTSLYSNNLMDNDINFMQNEGSENGFTFKIIRKVKLDQRSYIVYYILLLQSK